MSGVEFPLTDGMIDFLVAELPDAACRDLLRELLRERRANGGDAVGRAALEFLRVEVARELREIRAAVGTPVADRHLDAVIEVTQLAPLPGQVYPIRIYHREGGRWQRIKRERRDD